IVSFWEIAAFVGNAVAFLLIGFETNLTLFYQAAGIILVAYASTVIARAVTVYPTFAVFNRLGAKMPFSWGNIAFLGGVRGALSIALLATLAASGTLSGSEMSILTAMVLGVVFISLVVQVPLLSNYAAKLFGRHRKPKDLQ
ncbi:MAG: cation:proton antiporter, partial [Candidatus Micrarchaeota archaeon]|nr:cation:proton antiporter [Candidatus Micrarchaeota archaeon]